MTIDGSSRASELARATAHHIQSDGYLVLEKGVSAERVAGLLHMSRSAVHSSLIRLGKGGNDKGLLRNLAEHWLDPERTGATRELAAAMKASVLETPEVDPVRTIKAMCEVYFADVATQPIAEVQLALWVGRDDPEVADQLRSIYRHLDDIVADLFDSLLSHWGRKMRPGFSTATLAACMGALVEGLVVRRAVDPEAVTDDLFGVVLLGLFPALTQDADEAPVPFQSAVSRYTRPTQSFEGSTIFEVRARALAELTQEIQRGGACRTISVATLAERMRMDEPHLELIIGSIEKLVAEELASAAQALMVLSDGEASGVSALTTITAGRSELVRFFLLCVNDPHPAPVAIDTLQALGGMLQPEAMPDDCDDRNLPGYLAETALRLACRGFSVERIQPVIDALAAC
ncbi:MAG: TetR family transcriptional regulator C-terminal domain-containing protein [Candidatus Neomicrothrix subdominans]|jgi:hypothetical protein